MPYSLTRREFLKDLGLAGAGITLAPAAVTDSGLWAEWDGEKTPAPRRPAWVKTADKPTVEIDWDMMRRYPEWKTCRRSFPDYVGEERLKKLNELRAENTKRFLKENKPGYTLKDWALLDGIGLIARRGEQSFLGPQTALTPEERGVPRWEGSPEDAAHIVTAAMRQFGAATVGFVELDPNTTRKLIYAEDPDKKRLEFADVDEPSEDDEKRVIPNKARWAIVYTVQMSEEGMTRAPTALGDVTTYLGYAQGVEIQARLQDFLRALGYMGLGESSINALGIAPAFAVMAGLGELSRFNRLITPEYGPVVRVFKLVTDLPLVPGKPIDAGIMEFCKRCKKCADHCPAKALSFDTEPTWEVRGPWNNPGHKAYFEDSVKCRSYWSEVLSGCTICFAVCPFTAKDKALIHHIRNRTAAATPIFDNVFKRLDDVFYTPNTEFGVPQKDPEEWWTLDLPEYGFDSTRGKRDA